MLESWTDGPTKSAIVDFVGRVTAEGPDYVAPEARVAVFDNDGTLWCEKPMYIQLDFIIRRLAERAAADASLAGQQPYQAAVAGDLQWFGGAITKHYQGDDTDLKVLAGAVMSLHEAMNVEDHAARVSAFFAEAKHPTLNRPYQECIYTPMVELLRYLEGNGFTCYIVSGGGRDFMRPITAAIYGIPPERVVGSAQGLKFEGAEGHGDLLIQPALDIFDDGPEKPVRVWSRDRQASDPVGGQFQRRRRDAAVLGSAGGRGTAVAGSARRCRTRIRLHRRGGTGTGACREVRLDRRQHEERLDDRLR